MWKRGETGPTPKEIMVFQIPDPSVIYWHQCLPLERKMGCSEPERWRQIGPLQCFPASGMHWPFFFFPPKKIKKMLFGCKNTGSIPSIELLITGRKSQDNCNIKADHKGFKGVPAEAWVLRQSSVTTRGRCVKPGWCPGHAC